MHACYSGPEDQAERVLSSIYKAGQPLDDGIEAVDYVAIQRSWDRTDPRNSTEYLKSGFISEFPSSLVDTLVENYEAFADRGMTVFFQHLGGAIGRVPAEATAFAHRKSLAAMFIVVSWPLGEPDDSHIAYAGRNGSTSNLIPTAGTRTRSATSRTARSTAITRAITSAWCRSRTGTTRPTCSV